MAKPLASKPASPRRQVPGPGYPVLVALALSLPIAACFDTPAGSPAPPFHDAGAVVDTPAANVHDVNIDRRGDVGPGGGTSIDSESEGALDAQSMPSNSDPAGIFAYAFTPASAASSDDAP